MVSRHPIPTLVLILVLALGLFPFWSIPVHAQAESQSEAADIVVEGPVQALNVNVITLADMDIVLDSSDPLLLTLHVGDVIRVEGDIAASAGVPTIQATTVVITGANIVSPVMTLTGPVQAINVNIVTIFNMAIQFNPSDPILLVLQVGDVIQVSGNLSGFNGSVVIVPVQVEIIVKVQPEATPDPGNGVLIRGFVVMYGGRDFDGSKTTFTYVVSGTGTPPDLSHFDLEIPVCVPPLQVVGYNPTQAVSFGVDPTTGVTGIKWDLSLGMTETRTYTITFAGNVPEGTVVVAVKGGNGFESATLPGAGCSSTAVDVEKLVSVDGGTTWQDAVSAPGPDVSLGTGVMFRLVVKNIGQTELTNLALTDNIY
ncbi:MAG: hypothetical protein K8J31_00245, partial [Anaerolineae bacterium]|nr:hypothetical protein [Anaerolineae bacterium]